MNDLDRLSAIEEIKQLKAKYFYFLDYQDWDSWRDQVFTADIQLFVPEAMEEPVIGIDALIEWVKFRAANQISTHYGHMPIIEILTDRTAKGIWAMEDILRLPKDQPAPGGYTYLHGFGHYHETYAREPAGWRISTVKLTRLHVERL